MEDQQTLKNSMPCKHCRDYLIAIGFKTIFCSTEEGTIEKFKLIELPDHESTAQKNLRLGIPLSKSRTSVVIGWIWKSNK